MGSVFYKGNHEGEDDLMVSGITIPMTARVEILGSSSSVKGILMALWGYTRYLVSPQVVAKLGMKLRKPTAFSQLGSLISASDLPNQACEAESWDPHRDYLVYCDL